MPVVDPSKTIQIRFNAKYSNFFDEVFNCDLSNRTSDSGLIEKDRPMLRPRPGTWRVGDTLITTWSAATAYVIGNIVTLNGVNYKCILGHTNQTPPNVTYWTVFTTGNGKEIFYTDRLGTRRNYRTFDNQLYYLNGSTWTSLASIGTTDVDFSIQKVPVLNIRPWSSTTAYVIGDRVILNGIVYTCILGHTNFTPPDVTYWVVSDGNPTSRTSPTVATGAEKVKKDAADTLSATNNVGKILIITSGVYKWCYASIISYDVAGTEYTLGGAGIITALPASTTYKICDFVSDVLMICRGTSNQTELFYDGIIPLAHYTGYTTDSLRQVAALSATETVSKLVLFVNQCWTYKWGTLYYTGGFPGNPFFFNFTTSLTVGWNGTIVDIFQYKSRLVTLWTNFVFSIPSTLIIDRHITTFGGVKDAYVNTGEDIYLFTTQKTIVSLNETISGIVGVKLNVAEDIKNYTSTFATAFCFGFDGRKLYMYGQADTTTTGYLCVLDTLYNFWTVYTGLRPTTITQENGVVYMPDNNSDIVRYFDSTATTDVTVGTSQTTTFSQYITSKEIDFDDVFTTKTLTDLYILFENYTQSVYLDIFMALNNQNSKKQQKTINTEALTITSPTIWEWVIGEHVFWVSWFLSTISVPIMKHTQFASDPVNLLKFRISGKDGSLFYLSQIDLKIMPSPQKEYFDPSNTN